MLSVTWCVLAVMALTLAILMPGAAFTVLVPVLVYAVLGTLGSVLDRGLRREVPLFAAMLALVVAVWSSLYQFLLADVVLGYQLSHFKVLPLLLFALPLLPLAVAHVNLGSTRALMAALVLSTAVAAVIGMLLPAHTFDRPRGVNLVYVQDEAAAPVWLIESFGEPGRDVLEALGFDQPKQDILRYGVVPREAYVRPATPLGLLAPIATIDEDIVQDGKRLIRGTVRSQRDAYTVLLSFAPDAPVDALRIEGQLVLEQASDQSRAVGLHGVGNAPVRFEIAAPSGVPLNLVVLDIAPLAPVAEAAQLLARRPGTAAPLHNGDQSIVLHRLQL